jgi:hypothetical protein
MHQSTMDQRPWDNQGSLELMLKAASVGRILLSVREKGE